MNFLKRDKALQRQGSDGLSWKALTTGNYGGFDAIIEHADTGVLKFESPLISFALPLCEVGLEDRLFERTAPAPGPARSTSTAEKPL